MKVIPLHDRVLLKRLEEQEIKKGGIIIPDTAKEKPQEASASIGKAIISRPTTPHVSKDVLGGIIANFTPAFFKIAAFSRVEPDGPEISSFGRRF